MHTARTPPVDVAPATITAVLAMHAGHICPSSELNSACSSTAAGKTETVNLESRRAMRCERLPGCETLHSRNFPLPTRFLRPVILVVAAPPCAFLVASLGGAVEPLEHAPEAVQPARVRGIGVVDDAILERERAHA